MSDAEKLKKIVREKYGAIARQSERSQPTPSSCCGKATEYSVFNDCYTNVPGHVESADLALGCGLPVRHARIAPGDTVVDLGSGAGNDAFVARAVAGATGRVIGIDMTEEMIDKARRNQARLGFDNVEFRLGEIESLPLESDSADVVVSNCVLNLVPDKNRAFAEIHRVLKPGGHFCISDVVHTGTLPDALLRSADMWAGCVAGSMPMEAYLETITRAGFEDVQVKVSKPIEVPAEVMAQYLTPAEIDRFRSSGAGLASITVTGEKSGPAR